MEQFRKLKNNIFFKLLLLLIAVSFVMFGISNFIFGIRYSDVAKVGDATIPLKAFMSELTRSRQAVYKYNNNKESLDYLNSPQFKEDILSQMVMGTLLNKGVESVGIVVNDKIAVENISVNPSFADKDGNFDRELFDSILRQNDINEDYYIFILKENIAKRLLVKSLTVQPIISQKQFEDIYKYRQEKRIADVITISEKSIGDVGTVRNDQLRVFFDKHLELFALPELREVSYIVIDPKEIAKSITVSDKEVKSEYDKNIDSYKIPETRDIYVMNFDNEKDAEKALTKLNEGAEFVKTAEETMGKTEDQIHMRGIVNGQFSDQALNDAIFALEEGKYSNLIKGSNSNYFIFYLVKENPETVYSFADIKQKIKDSLLKRKTEEALRDLISNVDDEILVSNSLENVANKFNLPLKKAEAFDSRGVNAEGTEAVDINDIDNFVSTAFELSQGESSEIMEDNKNGTYFVMMVDKVNEARQRSFKEAKANVLTLYKKEETNEKIAKLSEKIYHELKAGVSISEIAKNYKVDIEKKKEFPRFQYMFNSNGQVNAYANDLMLELFKIDRENITTPCKIADDEYQIGILKVIMSVDMNKYTDELQQMVNETKNSFLNDITSEYDKYLRKEYPVKIRSERISNI